MAKTKKAVAKKMPVKKATPKNKPAKKTATPAKLSAKHRKLLTPEINGEIMDSVHPTPPCPHPGLWPRSQ
ncbi:MAG TPA: hypothetical protein VG605_17390 [Puia sp.]|nr:hypothetical protein [Puia sp.]